MALFYATIRIDSVSLLKYPLFCHIQVFSCEISLVILFYTLRVFDARFNWLFYTLFWVTAIVLWCPGPFSVFLLISMGLCFELFRFFIWFLIPPVSFPSPWGSFPTFMFNSFFSSKARSTYLYHFSPCFTFIFSLSSAGTAKFSWWQVLFFRLIIIV